LAPLQGVKTGSAPPARRAARARPTTPTRAATSGVGVRDRDPSRRAARGMTSGPGISAGRVRARRATTRDPAPTVGAGTAPAVSGRARQVPAERDTGAAGRAGAGRTAGGRA